MLISLIVPVYNAASTLPRALESFSSSPGEDYEMVVVLDGEQDECYAIVESYREKDPRIQCLYPHRRLGASLARKMGIQSANGKYCCFLDADDYLEGGALGTYEELCKNGRYDIVTTSFYTDCHGRPHKNLFVSRKKEMTKSQAFEALLKDSYVRGFLWCKMVRRDLLLGAFSVVGNDALFEDTCLSAYAFVNASFIYYAPVCLYHYVKAEGDSAVHKPRTNRSSYHLAAFASIRIYLEKRCPELLPSFFKAKNRSYWSLWYDRSQDRKYGLSEEELKIRKREFRDIFDPLTAMFVEGTSYEEMVDPSLLSS